MRRTSSVRISTVVLVSVRLAMGGSSSASSGTGADAADPLPEVAAAGIADPISPAELQDLETIADQSGMMLQQVVDRYSWQDNFSISLDEIRAIAGDAFSGAEIVDAHNAWVGYAVSEPEAARAVLAKFTEHHPHVQVEVRTDTGFSERNLQAAIESVYYASLRQSGVRDAAAWTEDNEIVVTVVVDAKQQLGDVRLAADAALGWADGAAALTVRVEESARNSLGGDDSASKHMGGEYLSGCTSGFGTRKKSSTNGKRGISTAGHCGNSQSDDGTSLTYKSGHQGTHGDFQWHRGPKTMNDNFYSGSSTSTEVNSRDVSGKAAPAVGQTLCRNGRTSKKDCQQVRKLNVCAGGKCNLVQMGARLAAGGDSGGPVFYGNTAYGLHQGWMYDPVWPFDRDLFSRADRIDNALGIHIATK